MSDYSARAEFVARLVWGTSEQSLQRSLIDWSERFESVISIEELCNQIEQEQKRETGENAASHSAVF